jgi:hypothetical protein
MGTVTLHFRGRSGCHGKSKFLTLPRTDGQRLSALTPWETGKLAGSSAIAWYGGLICLAVYVSASTGSSSPKRLATSAASLIGVRRGRVLSSRSRGAGGMIVSRNRKARNPVVGIPDQ